MKLWGKWRGLLWSVSFGAFAYQLISPLSDFDLWWQLAAGKVIVDTRSLLRTDVFSSTMFGSPWINFEWLGQVILYLSVKWFGLTSVYYGKIILSLTALGLTVLSAFVAGLQGPLLLAASWFMFFIMKFRLNERLELFSLNFTALFILLVLLFRKHHTPTLRRHLPWIFFLLMVIWVNIHSGFVCGIAVVVLFALGARWARESPTLINLFDRLVVVVMVAHLVNPFGPKIILALIENFSFISTVPSLFSDTPAMGEQLLFWVLFIVTSVILVIGLLDSHKEAKLWAFLITTFAAWGALVYGNTIYFVLVAFPFLGAITKKILNKFQPVGYLILTMIFALHWHQGFKKPVFDELDLKKIPMGACRFIKDKKIDGKMFNSYEFGGYIEWFFGPFRKIFVDGRYIFFENVAGQMKLFGGTSPESVQKAWRDYLEVGRINYAIVSYPRYEAAGVFKDFSPLNYMFPRAGWALVYWDDAALVFLRRDLPEYAPVIQKWEYKFLWPYNFSQMEVMLKQGDISKGEGMMELTRHRQFVGNTSRGRQLEELFQSF